MDNASDDTITFDEYGYCNYCTTELNWKDSIYFPNKEGQEKLEAMLLKIKQNSKKQSL